MPEENATLPSKPGSQEQPSTFSNSECLHFAIQLITAVMTEGRHENRHDFYGHS